MINQRKLSIPLFSSVLLCTFGFLLSQTAFAETSTNVSVTTNTGGNTINGTTVTQKSSSHTVININGKEYVNDDTGGSHDIVENTNGGRVEVHVNSNKTQPSAQVPTNTQKPEITAKPTLTPEKIKELAQKRQEEVKKMVEKRKEEIEKEKTFIETLQSEIASFFSKIAAMFGNK